MRRLFMFLLVFVLLFAVAPVLAQEATPEPPPVEEPPVVVVSPSGWEPEDFILAAVAFGLLAAFVLVLRPAILQLGFNAPASVVDAGFAAADKLVERAIERAAQTPTKVDDSLFADIRLELDSLREEIKELRNVKPQQEARNTGPLPPGGWPGPGRTPGS
jgi:hypothetical protein